MVYYFHLFLTCCNIGPSLLEFLIVLCYTSLTCHLQHDHAILHLYLHASLLTSTNLQATLNKEINHLGIINKRLASFLALSILNNRILPTPFPL